MAGCSWSILAVGLLGCTRTCQMAQESSIARLNGTYRTVGTYRGQTGTLRSTDTRPPENAPARSGWQQEGLAERTPQDPGPRGAPRARREPAAYRSGDDLPLSAPLVVMPAIPTSGLARSGGIILDVWIIRLRGVSGPGARVSSPYVPNIGITGTIGTSPAIRMLGHRRTSHTTPNGPTIQLSPVDQMVGPA